MSWGDVKSEFSEVGEADEAVTLSSLHSHHNLNVTPNFLKFCFFSMTIF
jgi:hypothetical protein